MAFSTCGSELKKKVLGPRHQGSKFGFVVQIYFPENFLLFGGKLECIGEGAGYRQEC